MSHSPLRRAAVSAVGVIAPVVDVVGPSLRPSARLVSYTCEQQARFSRDEVLPGEGSVSFSSACT
jgi:hypothetical protein